LPLRLLRLKNGDETARQRYAKIQELFRTLAPDKTFDLSYAAVPGQTSPSGIEATDNSTVELPEFNVTVLVRDETVPPALRRELSIFQHGAGTWEALVLAEALADADHRVVILDEPGPTLHPTWQRLLKSRLGDSPGQVVLVTHSASLVPVETASDLHRLVRLGRISGSTRPRQLPPTLDTELTAKLIKEFSLSADARAMLFARGVVLFEGETELGALPTWFAKSPTAQTRGTPDDHDLAFYSVGGHTNFQTVLTLLAALGIPWTIVCDGAAFAPPRDAQHIFRQADHAGTCLHLTESLDGEVTQRTMDSALFEKLVRQAEGHGIFTLAKGWTLADKKAGMPGDESIEVFIETVAPGLLAQARQEAGTSKVRRGRWVAEITDSPAEVDKLYGRILDNLAREENGHAWQATADLP
jgi:OLD-like protein